MAIETTSVAVTSRWRRDRRSVGLKADLPEPTIDASVDDTRPHHPVKPPRCARYHRRLMPRQPTPISPSPHVTASGRASAPRTPRHWLVKSEASCYSIDDLKRDGTTCWDGVRNYQARNFIRDEMRLGDLVLFHHSNGDPSGIAGVARVVRESYTDHTAFDPKHEHHDPRSDRAAPAWVMVDLRFVERFPEVVSLERLKAERGLESMLLLRRGQRLSVMPVEGPHFERICALGRAPQRKSAADGLPPKKAAGSGARKAPGTGRASATSADGAPRGAAGAARRSSG